MDTISIFTDGACSGNPGKGGYAAILSCGNLRKTITGGFRRTTNNRMELMAVLEGLRAIKGTGRKIHIFSDSQVFVSPFNNGTAASRLRHGNQANGDLWAEILAIAARNEVTAEWVKGHNGHPENTECDALAVNACQTATAVDYVYEREASQQQPLIPETPSAESLLLEVVGQDMLQKVLGVLIENGYRIVPA